MSGTLAIDLHAHGTRPQEATGRLALFTLVCMVLPRVQHPALPYNLSNIEVLGFFSLGLLAWLLVNNRGQLEITRDFRVTYIIFFPFLSIGAAILGFLFLRAPEVCLETPLLQALRRIFVSAFLLVTYQTRSWFYRRANLKVVLLTLILAAEAGSVLFYAIEYLEPMGIKNTSHLGGNLVVTSDTIARSSDFAQETLKRRLAGNAGSVTIFAAACAVLITCLICTGRELGFSQAAISFHAAALGVCLFTTSSKSVLAVSAVVLVWLMLLKQKFRLVMVFATLTVIGVAVGFSGGEIRDEFTTRASVSFYGRLARYEHAFQEIDKQPLRLVFGEGWKSRAVGWHSELVEMIMAFGVLPSALLIALVYFAFPLSLLRRETFSSPVGQATFFSLVIILFASLFQDVFHDPNVLLLMGILAIATIVNPELSDLKTKRAVAS